MHRKDLLTRIFMSIISVSLILSMVACGDDKTSSKDDEKEESSYSDVSKTEDSKEDISDSEINSHASVESIEEMPSEESEASEALSHEESSVEESKDEELSEDEKSFEEESTEDEVSEDEVLEDLPVIEANRITSIFGEYSDGYAFVEIDNDKSNKYCIDKNGNVKFKLDESFYMVECGFKNGYAVLFRYTESQGGEYCLCDENGNITVPHDVGATYFSMDNERVRRPNEGPFEDLLSDGYIIVVRHAASEIEVVNEYGIMNTDFEMVVDYSEDLDFLLRDVWHYKNGIMYGNDYSVWNREEREWEKYSFSFFEINNPMEIEHEMDDFLEKANANPSDVWYCDYFDGEVFDFLNTEIFNLSVYGTDVDFLGDFENGVAPIRLISGENIYFSVVDEENNLKFEPILIGKSVHSSYCGYDNGKYLYSNWESDILTLYVFDETGLIKNYEFDDSCVFRCFSDERIIVCVNKNNSITNEYTILTTDFEPAF